MAFGQRVSFAVIAIPLLVAAIIWLPAWAFLSVLAVAVVIACDELLSMARAAGFAAGRALPLVLIAGVMAASWMVGPAGLAVSAAFVVIVVPTSRLTDPAAPEGSLGAMALETFAVLYLGITAACFGWLRLMPGDPDGVKLLFFYLACIWVGDSGAYFTGKSIGRHKMSPRISPNKTLEGLAGAIVTTFITAAVAAWALDLDLAPIHVAALAAILAVTAPLGDLVESAFKRDSGVKDSSALIPGHGGLLDRTDSLVYPAPFVLAYLMATGLV